MTSEPRRPWWAWGCTASTTPADLRNLGRFNLLCLLWAAALVLATAALHREWITSPVLAAVLATATALFGLAPVAAFRRYLRQADELQRRIQLEGIALGFGGGLVAILSYQLFELLGAPEMGVAEASLVFIVLWAVGQVLAVRRYR